MASNLTPQQQAAAYAPCSLVVTAGAGTGKTHMLAERYLYYLRDRDLSPLSIVAVTFTEKAATELRSRIRTLVSQQLPTRLDLLAELEAAPISTIHALASRICQEHYQIVDLPAEFTLLDDLEGKIWLQDSLTAALARLPRELYEIIPYSLLVEVVKQLLADPYTADLAFKQGIQDWSKLIIQARTIALVQLVNDPIWQSTWSILEQYHGKAGDKLEVIRQQVVGAMADLEAEVNITKAIAILNGIKLNVGSKKNWQGDSLATVKAALKSLRDGLVKKICQQGLINLTTTAADAQLKTQLPAVNEAYREITAYLDRCKQQAKILTFSDLEIYALQALKHPEVRDYYQQRWQVYLVDEFQDTNPTQGELLTTLTRDRELTIVGDIKQSIYGFRRADIRLFEQFRQRILKHKGKEVILQQSFRTHQNLIATINRIFVPLLGKHHQELHGYRQTEPGSTAVKSPGYLQVFTIEVKSNKTQRQRLEAATIAQKLKQMLDSQTPVFDKSTQQLRPLQPQDIAILTRTWQPLSIYGEALAAAGIPVAPAGGGNLLATREAKDATALLRWLGDSRDDIALVAVLRSPFFALSDRLLFKLQTELSTSSDSEEISWWQLIQTAKLPELDHPLTVLQQLCQQSQTETPSRLLQIADRLTGYTAVIANLPGAERRLADWQGFCQLVKQLQQGTGDLFGVVRRLKRLYDESIAIPRPNLTVTNAVSLMTIFAAKGLEWSVVVVADLSRERPHTSLPVYFDAQWGVALNCQDTSTTDRPVLYRWLEYQQQQQEDAEALRVLYVALTRARDYLILSATEADKGNLAKLKPGLAAANIPIDTIPFVPAAALPPIPPMPQPPSSLPPLLLDAVGCDFSELPVTALTEYARCPQRFKLHFIQGHPGIGEGLATGMQVGTLVHKALEYNITNSQDLLPFTDASWQATVIAEAIALAQRFWQLPLYRPFRQTAIAKEQPISYQIGKITFNGVIDLVGQDWVLDYKSDRARQPLEHRFQLWVYATALQQTEAHIAYLRHDYIHTFTESDLKAIAPEIKTLVAGIEAGNYHATPTLEKCAFCPYLAFCDFAII